MPDNLINIKHSKDTIAGDMKDAVISLIKMCTDGLNFLAHGNNLLNQTHRNCVTCLTSSHVELGKKVPENSDWLSGGNILSRINQIKPKQQALRSYWFKNSKNLQGFSKNFKNQQNGYYQKQPSKV